MIAKLVFLVAMTLAGTCFSIWRGGFAKGWLSALVLLGISALLGLHGDHPLQADSPPIVWVALLGGLAFGLCFPCCGPTGQPGVLAIIATAVVVVHCLLDGHVVREVNTLPLIAMFGIHKFVDGADGRLLSLNGKTATFVARVALALATPIGFLAIPPNATPPAVHLALFATVIGFNGGAALNILRHELHRLSPVAKEHHA